jgi:hypothetical protein
MIGQISLEQNTGRPGAHSPISRFTSRSCAGLR